MQTEPISKITNAKKDKALFNNSVTVFFVLPPETAEFLNFDTYKLQK